MDIEKLLKKSTWFSTPHSFCLAADRRYIVSGVRRPGPRVIPQPGHPGQISLRDSLREPGYLPLAAEREIPNCIMMNEKGQSMSEWHLRHMSGVAG